MMGKTALVTGAAVGIGRACAMRLADDGIAVGVLDIDIEGCRKVVAEIAAAGGKAVALQASVADRAQVEAAVATLRSALGPVTILVNNAGITATDAFKDITDELWDRVMAVNVKGTFIVTQTVLPDMEAAKWGRIVNMASSSAQTGVPKMAHYSSSKGAIITFTRSLAQELGPLGITVNTIPPGSIANTVMFEANRDRMPLGMDALVNSIPVRRTGEPADIANACAWLVSDASSYITGQIIGVNGGRVVT
jgi:2-hydroxycyclohexanecarboxyl-CoA dehydrogenase